MATPLIKWCQKELSRLLAFETSEDIVRYILAIETSKELEDYLLELLNPEDEEHRNFVQELLRKWKPNQSVPGANPGSSSSVKVYQKDKEDEVYFAGTKPKEKNKKPKPQQKEEEREDNEEKENQASSEKSGARKKTKYVDLYGAEGEAKQEVRLPGRHACLCQAAKHKLINNCLKCGRIVCDQEGSGPCFHCGNLVCTKEEREFMSQGTKKAEQLRRKLLSSVPPHQKQNGANSGTSALTKVSDVITKDSGDQGLTKAQAHKNQLLEFDKTHTQRTQVIDDEADYYATGSAAWLSKDERVAVEKREEEKRAKRFASRREMKITFDFAGRQIVDDEESAALQMYTDPSSPAAPPQVSEATLELIHSMMDKQDRHLVNPSIRIPPPTFVDSGTSASLPRSSQDDGRQTQARGVRLQDKELMQLRDEGVALSMHQPWASFLVKGIKKHEGRTWYSSHRGRLWIASTAKAPTAMEIVALENEYRNYYKRDIDFPNDYPTGCLLGAVDVTDIVGQDEYRQRFGGERQDPMESESPFVFVCENPQELFIKFPIKGQHKIYKLDPHVHQSAKKGARSVEAPTHSLPDTEALRRNFQGLNVRTMSQVEGHA